VVPWLGMQGFEFYQYLNAFPTLKKHFKGIFSIDTLPKFLKFRHFLICNTDISTGSGLHWFVLIRNSKYGIECFDSLGISSNKKEQLEKHCKFRGIKELEFNETQFQLSDSDTCGLFAIFYIFQRMHNLDMSFEEILEDIFNDSKIKNEEIVQQFCSNIQDLE
jgi:hypothetical protein